METASQSHLLRRDRASIAVPTACVLAVGGFLVAVLSGMYVENPLGAILARSLVTLVVCWPLGLVIGLVLDRLFREHASKQTSQMEQEDLSAEEAGGDAEILDESEGELDSSGVDVAVASASDSA
ncbi:MAG: hypothetical protein CMJ27_06105 [Phycisphaerae bacterium]|nr:hypothetical protein [Phycisphaerae bacterium]OUX01690.1 MAG: hypothetical protein CBD91_03915 [Phycisphaeraceae bacterium TMED231]